MHIKSCSFSHTSTHPQRLNWVVYCWVSYCWVCFCNAVFLSVGQEPQRKKGYMRSEEGSFRMTKCHCTAFPEPWCQCKKLLSICVVCVCGCLKVSAKSPETTGSFGHTYKECWCVNMRLDHQKGDVFVMVCVCNLHANIWLSDILFWERPYAFFPLFFYSTAQHTLYSLSYTHAHMITILQYLGSRHLFLLHRE